jgi:hypothetical protein
MLGTEMWKLRYYLGVDVLNLHTARFNRLL